MTRSSSLEWWRADVVARTPPAVHSAATDSRDSSVPFWALMAFTFFMLVGPQSIVPGLASLRLNLVTGILAVTGYVFDRLVHHRPLTLWSREIGIAVCLGGWAIVTVPLSYAPENSMSFFLNGYAISLALFWLLSNILNTVKRLGQAFWVLTLTAVPLSLTALSNFFSGEFLQPGTDRIIGYEAALTGNPNDLALMINLLIPFGVALLLVVRRPLIRLLLLAVVCLSIAAVIVTFSRAGFLTLASLLLLYVWKFRRRRERRWAWLVVVFLVAFIPVAGPAYLNRIATITDIEADKTHSAQERWSLMEAAVRYTSAHPLIGSGIGQNVLALREEGSPGKTLVHNAYLEYVVELGVPGLIMFMILLFGSVNSAVRVQRECRSAPASRQLFYFGEAIQVSLIAFAIAALFHPVAYHPYFYYIAGLAVAARAVCERQTA
jgi:probable O-glycosylation ligase (exosortase A-associated)